MLIGGFRIRYDILQMKRVVYVKSKSKAVPLHAMEALGGEEV
jgi:hypothetical protein